MRPVGRLAVTLSRRSSLIVTQSHPSHIPVSPPDTKSAEILFGIFTDRKKRHDDTFVEILTEPNTQMLLQIQYMPLSSTSRNFQEKVADGT